MTTYYTVYETINTITNKIYVGVHKTTNPHDSYLGSGIIIREAIKKYGRKAFYKQILFIFETSESAYEKERELVNEAVIARDDTYNIQLGGTPSPEWSEERKSRPRLPGYMKGRTHSEETRRKISEAGKGRSKPPESVARQIATRKMNGNLQSYWKGKSQSAESNKKRSISHTTLEKVECPHCHKKVEPGNATRWHFDNCAIITGRTRKDNTLTCPHCAKTLHDATNYMKKYHFDNCKHKSVLISSTD